MFALGESAAINTSFDCGGSSKIFGVFDLAEIARRILTDSRGDSGENSETATERRGYKEPIWKFTRWDVVDLSQFKVKLKAEFQGSNRDLYRPEAIVGSSSGK
jgi:hypothetical protein